MKTHVGDHEFSFGFRRSPQGSARRKTVSQILRAAYRKHVRDEHTKLAVRRWLR